MRNRYFGLTLDAAHTTVMQSVFVDDVTRQIFVSQAKTGTVEGRETTVVSRLSPAGVLLDSMEFVDAGHGTCVFSETDPVTLQTWVWLNVIRHDTVPGTHQLARVPWVAGASYTGLSPQVTSNRIDTFTSLYTLANADVKNDVLLMRETSGSTEYQYLRSLSDLKNGINRRLTNNIVTSTATDVVQGFATVGHEFFIRYLGSSTEGTARLQIWDWLTGQLVRTEVLDDLRYEADGSQDGGFSEPEGLSVFRTDADPETPYIVVGLSGGVSGRRTHRFGVATDAESHPWQSQQALVDRHLTLTMPDRKAFQPPASITSLATLTRPGWHYLTTAQFDQLTDKPSGAQSGAYMVLVSGRNNGNSAVVQRLTRFSLADGGEWVRVIDFVAGTAQPWYLATPSGGGTPAPTRQTFTPTLSNITLGNGGTAVGEYAESGGYIDAEVVITLGSGGSAPGTLKVGLPVPGRTNMLVAGANQIAQGTIHDVSASAYYPIFGVPPNTSGTEVQLRYRNSSGALITGSPVTMANGDKIVLTFHYPKA